MCRWQFHSDGQDSVTWAIPAAVWLAIVVAVFYDANGRAWHGWTSAGFWGAMAFLFSVFAVPFYLLARARSSRVAPVEAPSGHTVVGPGWLPDPHGQHRLRYWDGARWTNETAD
ncbi:DUF2510 domain-containing protein [Baekduia soli]|uniref:DUF2510 domain-containing protein n=1 Tax=Baekduia soli TaxID=496014 RepID=A0A5B8U4R7_9ACTN|nr:DUF2510 domain-containing protein [Baekduia soli]QEC47848.1 DUF2510 domain-containing protein [Baekduia soli]